VTKAKTFRDAFMVFAEGAQGMLGKFNGSAAFVLYDTYGFPLDLTQLLARERGLEVEVEEFERLMEEQRTLARKAQQGKKTVIELSQVQTTKPTRFVGYDQLQTTARVMEVVRLKDRLAVILDYSTCYAEMGGQVGDHGELRAAGQVWQVVDTQKNGPIWLHLLKEDPQELVPEMEVQLMVDRDRREAIQRHHTVTHIFHWALHEVASREASQKGSFVGPDKMTFDFNSAPLTPAQVMDIEKLVNQRILENVPVSWTEVPYASVSGRADVMQLFGEKYGDEVRVVQIGGQPGLLDGYSMELCGGTHARATGEIGMFRIVSESAIAAGVRRVEAVAGMESYGRAHEEMTLIRSMAGKVNAPVGELEKKLEALMAQQKEMEKQLKTLAAREATDIARRLVAAARQVGDIPVIIENLKETDGKVLQTVADALKSSFNGVVVLGSVSNGSVALLASVSSDLTGKVQAGKLIQAIAPLVGGKGGGRPDNARGGGKDASKLDEALAKAASFIEGNP
jgi:alanyl-tRNA synthetase